MKISADRIMLACKNMLFRPWKPDTAEDRAVYISVRVIVKDSDKIIRLYNGTKKDMKDKQTLSSRSESSYLRQSNR